MAIVDSKKDPRLKDKADIKIKCPFCKKETKYYQLKQVPRDKDIQWHIDHDDDLQMPTEWNKNLYKEFLKIIGPDKPNTICSDLCYIEKHGDDCKVSGKEVILLNYTMMNHEEKTAGMTFRIVIIYEENSFITDQ